jgi:hypothetical protein
MVKYCCKQKIEYHGGHKDRPLGGILSRHSQSGKCI